jgi:hypothetical protein
MTAGGGGRPPRFSTQEKNRKRTMPRVDTIPTEQQMRNNECEVFTYKNYNVWFVAYDEGEAFTLGCVDDYDGGELYFPAYDIEFKPKAGTLAFFPSSTYYVHGVKEILAGVRYTSAHFWVPIKHKRLIEMTKNEQPVY